MNKTLFDSLLNKYLLETITEPETRQLFALLDETGYRELLKEYIGKDLEEGAYRGIEDTRLIERIKERLLLRRSESSDVAASYGENIGKKVFHVPFRRVTAVAAALLIVLTGIWFWRKNKENIQPLTQIKTAATKNDVPPGREGAILTLGDGTKVNLDSVGNGRVGQQGNAKIIKTDGHLAYDLSAGKPTEVLYNTITTPAAHELQLLLADGSKVWLNASSTLRFPTAFTGKDRSVELTGEGYFEVAHNTAMPFKVTASGLEVEDIGTQFNIMAYADEVAVKTTLVEGAIKVVAGTKSILLNPGEQAKTTKGEIQVQHGADVEEAIAWKNGLFLLKGEDVATVMRQVSRWYDVEIVYKGSVPKGHVMGDIPRTMNLSSVIEVFRQFGISCELDGKRLIVASPNPL